MPDAAHEQIDVAASPARCFAVATAFESYPEWTSDVKQVAVLERDALGRGTRVEYHVSGLGRRVRYVLAYDYGEAPVAFSWTLEEGDLLRLLYEGTTVRTIAEHYQVSEAALRRQVQATLRRLARAAGTDAERGVERDVERDAGE